VKTITGGGEGRIRARYAGGAGRIGVMYARGAEQRSVGRSGADQYAPVSELILNFARLA